MNYSRYLWILGDFDIDSMTSSYFGLVYLLAFQFVAVIVLMNLLIAIMGNSYQIIYDRQKQAWLVVRAETIVDIEDALKVGRS